MRQGHRRSKRLKGQRVQSKKVSHRRSENNRRQPQMQENLKVNEKKLLEPKVVRIINNKFPS